MRTRVWDKGAKGALTFTEIGFGGAPLGNMLRAIDEETAQSMLAGAWDGGLRYYDTAPLYGFGLSETRLNTFLRGKPRDSYVLSSKIGRLLRACPPDKRTGIGKWFEVPSRQEVYDYGYDATMRSLEFSLERLGVDRIDILYSHDMDTFNHGSHAALEARLEEFINGGYRALLRLRDEGVIRAFGAGVNEWQPCQWLLERGDFDIFLLAGRYTLLEQGALGFMDAAQARGVGVVIGGPYNSGILATGPVAGAYYNYDPAPPEVMDHAGRLQAVCAAHGVRLVDAAFRFPLGHPATLSVIPGGQGPAQMAGNLDAAAAEIPADLWADLRAQGLIDTAAPLPV